MATLKLLGFSGEIPKLIPRLLPDMSAQSAFNTRLDDGGLTPVRKGRLEHAFPGGAGASHKTIYRHGETWLGWDAVVNVAPGPVAQDRLYYTGDGVPKMRVDGTVYELAVPLPGTKLTATASGTGSGDIQTRIYTYTWVTDFGEESEPAPASDTIDWQPGQDVTLSGFEAVPSGRAITKMRIYRSQTGLESGTDFFLIDERAASSTDYTDTVAVEAIQEPLPSSTWNQPPDDLKGLISLPNGMMAAISGKELCFCEPWRPHAWPEGYRLALDYEGVGLGAFGTSIVVATKGNPYLVSGTHPASMIQERMELNLPCINERSIQDLGYAVAYATQEGLCVVSPGGARIATEAVMNRETWQDLVPEEIVSGQYEGRYLASYKYTDDKGDTYKGTIIIDLSGEQPFIIRSNTRADAFWYSITDSKLFYLLEGAVHEWDARGQVNEIQSWKSKRFVLPRPTNFGAILIEAETTLTEEEVAAIEALRDEIEQDNQQIIDDGLVNGALNSVPLNTYEVNGDALELPPSMAQFVAVAIYADRKLVALVNGVNNMKRLPSGFLARQWEVEVSGDIRVYQISLATTGAELMAV